MGELCFLGARRVGFGVILLFAFCLNGGNSVSHAVVFTRITYAD